MQTIYYNGKVYPMTSEHSIEEAVFVKDGVIQAVGSTSEIMNNFKQAEVELIDLDGHVMFPGFVDSHAHMLGYGFSLKRLDLSNAKSKEDVIEKLIRKAEELPQHEWLIGEGWNENEWVQPHSIHRNELDAHFPNRPVMITRICRHAMVVNSRALELAGVHSNTPDPSGGVIGRDDTGLNGLLLENAQDIIHAVTPNFTSDSMTDALTLAYEQMTSLGLTGVHTEDLAYYGNTEAVLDTYRAVLTKRERQFRVHHLVHHEAIDDWANSVGGVDQDWYGQTFSSMKIFADGSLGGHSAWLSEPYRGEGTEGVPIHSDHELEVLVQKARNLGMTVAVHVIGDAALAQTLDVLKKHPPVGEKKDRLIHLQITSQSLIEKMQGMPIVLDIQPQFTVSDFPWIQDAVPGPLLRVSYAWKTLLDHEIICAGGSDAPIEPPDPLLGIHAAVARRKQGERHSGYIPSEKLTVYEAISLYTSGSSQASGEAHMYGVIQPGFAADFTVLDQDPFQLHNIDELLNTNVVYTIVNGTTVYANKQEK
ncbi:LOW QUALITY PROTEIN: exoenzyme regulatory protein AepA precursor [Geomicrobium sp. JCM 19039]|nr:LOW QUALITY PROTEIN: exoenzyme regulatory protein AepA precursor [Geomicrobium sp. JCM 19039]